MTGYGYSESICTAVQLTTAGCLLQTEEVKHPLVAVVEVTIQLQEKAYKLWDSIQMGSIILYINDKLNPE